MKTVIVDYHKGNIKSVERGLAAQGADVVVSDDPAVVAGAGALVLPGVGAFADAMGTLDDLGLSSVIKERISAGVPFLGICLGLHLLYEGGMEHAADGPVAGLGIIPGVVAAMPRRDSEGRSYKVPHVGWNSVNPTASSPLFAGIDPGEYFYFTHSYIAPASPCTIAETEHSVTFPSAVQADNVFGVQFHPEKSSAAGARLLKNFTGLTK